MIRTTSRKTKFLCAAFSLVLAGAAACSNTPMSEPDETSNLPSTGTPSDEVRRIWDAYAACPEGCELSQEDADTLDAFRDFVASSPALSQESRDILQILGDEITQAGYHPSQALNIVTLLPSYRDPRSGNLFTSGEICDVIDEYDGNPPGTTLCVPEQTAYWWEPGSKTAVGLFVAGAAIGLGACLWTRSDCMDAAANARNNAFNQCDWRTQTLDQACAAGVRQNHEARCRPCGQNSPLITDYRGCCRMREN